MEKETEDLSFLDSADQIDETSSSAPTESAEDLSFLDAADSIDNNPDMSSATQADNVPGTNEATPLSAVVHGLESGFSYNTADDAGNIVDADTSSRFDASKKGFPVTYGLSNLIGAVISPNPVGKLAALEKAGLFIKTLVGLGKGAAEGTLATLGEAEGDVGSRLTALGENKLGIGISTIAGPLSTLSKVSVKDADVIVENGGKALKLGRNLQETLTSPEAQATVAKGLDEYAPRLKAAVEGAQTAVGREMDAIASKNASIPVKSGFLSEAAEDLAKIPDNQLDDATRAAKNRLMSSIERAEMTAALSSASRNSAEGSFEAIYQAKKQLGNEIWRNKIYNKSPEMKAKAVALYSKLSKALQNADEAAGGTGGKFREVSDTFSALYKTGEDAERLSGSVIKSLADPFDTAGKKVQREVFTEYNKLSPELRQKYMPGMDKIVNQELPELVTTARIVRKITGRMPGEVGKVSQQLSEKIPGLRYFTDAGRLELLNRLGAEQVGSKAKILTGAAEGISKTGSRGVPTMLTPDEDMSNE